METARHLYTANKTDTGVVFVYVGILNLFLSPIISAAIIVFSLIVMLCQFSQSLKAPNLSFALLPLLQFGDGVLLALLLFRQVMYLADSSA